MKKKVLLVKIDKPAGGSQRLSFSEPIGICYIAAFLHDHGVDCELLHLIGDNHENQLLRAMNAFFPDVVGFSVRNFNFNKTVSCIKSVRNHSPHASIVIGGECLAQENGILLSQKADVDLAIFSDGEKAFYDYVSGVPAEQIPGVIYRTDSKDYKFSKGLMTRVGPADLPMMRRTGLPMESYISDAFPGKKYSTMHVQRGCRYKCTFCHTACRYDKPLSRTPEQISLEIDHLILNYGVEALSIWDEDFFADLSRVRSIAEDLCKRDVSLGWQTFMKLTDLKNKKLQKLLPLLRKSGYVRSVIGLESFLPSVLKNYHKVGGPDIEESLKILTDNGIKICPAYIIGEPDETEEDVRYGLTHLLYLRERGIEMDLPYIAFITPFPGTAVCRDYEKRGLIIDTNMDHYDGEHVVVRSKCPPDKLIALRESFFKKFYRE